MSENQVKSNRLTLGEKLPLQIEPDIEKYLVDGWSEQASTHRWTVGGCAKLQFHLSELGTQNIILRMECLGYLAGGKLDHQTVEVLVNDSSVATWIVRQKAWHEAAVPNALIENGDMNVSLLISNPSAPFDDNLSNDKRKLGVDVMSIEIMGSGEVTSGRHTPKICITAANQNNIEGQAPGVNDQSKTDLQADKQLVKRNAIWITSYPKSGNTWIHSVLRYAGKNYGFPQIDMDAYNIVQKGEQPTICPAVNERFADHPCVVLKTHSAYKKGQQLHCFPETELSNAAYVHIYRNPLDVLLSYLNFTKLEYKVHANSSVYKKALFEDMLGLQQHREYEEWLGMNLDAIPQQNLDHALDYFSDNELTLKTLSGMSGSWIDHTRSWFDAAHDMPGYSIRYEDCLEDPEQFVKLCDLFTFDRKDVLSALDYVNARARSMSTSGNQNQAVFYNKMSAYYFTEYFSKEAITRFLKKNEAILKSVGYSSIFELV